MKKLCIGTLKVRVENLEMFLRAIEDVTKSTIPDNIIVGRVRKLCEKAEHDLDEIAE